MRKTEAIAEKEALEAKVGAAALPSAGLHLHASCQGLELASRREPWVRHACVDWYVPLSVSSAARVGCLRRC